MIVGYLICSDTSAGYHNVTVNGVVISNAYFSNSASDYSFSSIDVIVKKGDVFKSTNIRSGIDCSFVPFKTMNPVSLRPLDPHKIDSAVLNNWIDVTSDFSTAGSTSGVTLMFAKYNPFLTINFKLAYNGSQDITFGENTISTMTHFGEGSATILGGAEVGCKILSGSQIQIDMYNRNGNNAWAANDTFRGIIWL